MNPEANFDVSVDYNILNDAIAAIKNIKSKCSQLISDLSSVDVSILDSAGEMAAAIATAEGVMDGPVELVLSRIMEVETLFYMMQNQDFFVDLQEAMESGKFNDENGNLDIAAVMQHIVMNADGRYQDLLEDEDFRRMFVEQNILSVYGISSMEELENVRNGFLEQTRQYEMEKNGIVYDTSHLTKAFLDKIATNNSGFFINFDIAATTTIMAYSYTDVNGMEVMVDSLDAVPAEKRGDAKALSYASLCGDSDLYQELKGYLDGHSHVIGVAFNSEFSAFEQKINTDIEASSARLAELDNLINGEDGTRTKLLMVDGIVNDVTSRTDHLTNLYGYMINDDFEAMSQDLAGTDVVKAVTDYKSDLFDNFFQFTNNSVGRSDEMNILYSIISGNGEFQTVNGNVVVQRGEQSYFFNSEGDDTLSNFAYWADQMTEDEKTCFYYVWNTKGQDAAYDYLQNMSGVLDTRWVLNQREIDSAFASEHKVAASVYSVLANPFEGFSALVYSIKQGINDDNMTRTQVYSHGDTMRQTVSSELASESELAGFAYNVGMSMADNMYSMILTGGNSTLSGMILGVSSYNDSLNDALDRGLTDDQARLFAGASAGVEMLMEKMSIDELLDIKPIKGLMDVDVGDVAKLTDTQKGLKNFFGTLDAVDGYTDDVFQNSVLPKISGIGNSTLRNRTYDMANVIYNGVKQGIGEGNEELATSIAGRIIDDWIADENSSYNISVQSYINQGYTEAEAMAMANSEYRDELITSWLSGAASGTTMGGGQTIRGLVSTDIKVNGMLADYKTNPNYEAQLGELQSNMREGHYDAALTMVVDNSTSYEQGMSDANKLVDSLLNKGMISEEGKTQLNAYLEADAKAHTVLEGTSYETGNNVIRNIIRQDIMNKNVSDDDKYTRGLYLSSFDSGNSQRYEDANKIINNMEQNGIITSEQRDNMLIGVENRRNAVDMIGHLQKGDAAATLAARKNHTVVTESVPVVSETTSVTDMETQQSTAKSDTSVGSDFAATAGAFGNLGVIASQTGLGAIATLGMDTRSDSDVDPGKPKVYSDERIVIEDDSREKYQGLDSDRSVLKEVSQSEPSNSTDIFHSQVDSAIAAGQNVTELLNNADESSLSSVTFKAPILYNFSESTPSYLKTNPDFIMACVNSGSHEIYYVMNHADFSVLSNEQLASCLSILNDNNNYNPFPTFEWSSERNSAVQKYSANDILIANTVINSPGNYLNLVNKAVDFCSSDVLVEHIDEVLPLLKENHFNLLNFAPNAQIIANAFISDLANYSSYLRTAVDCCSKTLLIEHMDEILPILNDSGYSPSTHIENSAIIADSAVANASICPELVVRTVGVCSESVLQQHLDKVLPILNDLYYYFSDFRTNDVIMANKIVEDAINGKSTLYPKLFVKAVDCCSDSLISEHLDELLPILSNCNYTVTYEYGNARKLFIADSIIESPIKYPNLVVQAVSRCSENVIVKNIGDILPVLNSTGYTFDIYTSNNDVVMDAFLSNYASYPNLVNNFIDSSCLGEVSTTSQLNMLEIAQANGYKLNTKSNFTVLNSLLEPMIDLSKFDGKYKDYLSSVIENIGYAPLYFTGYDGLFSYEVIDTFGIESITEIYKYVTLKDVDIDFKSLIDSGKISDFKLLYDEIFKADILDSGFDIFSFKNFCNKYLENVSLFDEVLGATLSLEDKTLLKRFVVEDFGVEVKSLDDLRSYDSLVREKISEVVKSGNLDSIKDVGAKLLFNMSNTKMGEFLYTYGDSSRINLLSSKVGNSEFLSGASVLLDFFEKNILNNSDVERVRNIVGKLNSMKYEERASISKMFGDIERVVKYHYGEELNSNLTKLSDITSTDTVNTREVGKYSGVKHSLDGSESSALVDYVEINSNYRFLQHTLNAFGYGGKITDFLRARLVGNSYICLSLVGDGKVGVQRDATSINSVSLLFDTVVPQDLLLCGSEDLSSYTKSSNDLDVDVYVGRKDRLRFDISDNILANTSDGYHNEYTVYRDHIKPSGILVTGIVPNQSEIDAAATLGVPLVKINYSHNSNSAVVAESAIPSLDAATEIRKFVDNLSGDNSSTVIGDDGYELKPGESLGKRIGMQFFADAKTSLETAGHIVAEQTGLGVIPSLATNISNNGDTKIYNDERIGITDDSNETSQTDVKTENNGAIVSSVTDNIVTEVIESINKIRESSADGSFYAIPFDVSFKFSRLNAVQSIDLLNEINYEPLSTNLILEHISPDTFIEVIKYLVADGNPSGILLDVSDRVKIRMIDMFATNLEFIDNKTLSSILKVTSNMYDASVFNSFIGLLSETRIDNMVSEGLISYNNNLSDTIKSKFFDLIKAGEDKFAGISEDGRYGAEQSVLINSRSYVVKGIWSIDIKSLTDFIATEYKKYDWKKSDARNLAKKMMTPGSTLSGHEFSLLTKYVASNSKYSVRDILNTKFKCVQNETYTRILNKYESMGMDRNIVTQILDCIDTTDICSYADIANLIIDKYKDNPGNFKQDFGFDLYVEIDGKKVVNDAELLADMYITINSNLCGGKLFKYEDGKFNLTRDKLKTSNQQNMSGYTHNSNLINKYLACKNVGLQYMFSNLIKSTIDNPVELATIKENVIGGLSSGKQVSLVFCTTEENCFHLYDKDGNLYTDTAKWREMNYYKAHAVYVTGITDTDLIVSSWGQRFTIPLADFNNNEFGISISEIIRNQISQEDLVTEFVETIDMLVDVKQNGAGEYAGITSKLENKIKYLSSTSIIELFQKYDDSTGILSSLITNGNYKEINSAIMQLVSDGKIELLLSKFNVSSDSDITSTFSTLSNYVSDLTYTTFVDAILTSNPTHIGLISTLSDSGIVESFNKFSNDQSMITNLFNNLSKSQYTTIYNEYFSGGFANEFISEMLENAFNDKMSDQEVCNLLDAIYSTNNPDAIDFANEVMSEFGSDKINELINNGILAYNFQLNPLLKRQLHKQINQARDGFLSKLGGQYGVDQNAVGRNIKYSVSKPWVLDIKDFANYIKTTYKWDSVTAYFEAVRLNTPFFHIDSGDVRTITKYLASKDGSGIKETLDLERDILKRIGNNSFKQLHNEFSKRCVDDITAARILSCIDTTGACSYAAFANVIVNSYKNNPEGFKQDFGFDLYIEVNGKQQINSQQLMLDMYVYVNSLENGGRLFKTVDGKISLVGKSIDTSKQRYISARTLYNNYAFEYLASKNPNLTISYASAIDATDMSVNELKNAVGKALQSGCQLDMFIGCDLEHIIPFNTKYGTEQSTASWKEGSAHSVYVTGMTDKSLIISSWGKRYTIPFESLANNPEAAFIVCNLTNMSNVTDTSAVSANFESLSTENLNVETSEARDSISFNPAKTDASTTNNTTVNVDGSSYSVSSNISFKDKMFEKYYNSVLNGISKSIDRHTVGGDVSYSYVSSIMDKKIGSYLRGLTSGSKIYEIMSSLKNKQMLFYAINNCDLSLLSNKQLETVINKAVKDGYILNENSSAFVKSNPNIIMRLLQSDSYYFRKNISGTKSDIILKNSQKQDAFRDFINNINYDVLTSEQITEIIDIAVKNGYYISDKSPSFIKTNVEIISKVMANITETFHYNQTVNSIDYSSLTDADLLVLADSIGKSKFCISEFIPSNLKSNPEFIMQVVNSSIDGSINSKLSGVDYSNFSDQQLLDLIRTAVNKGYVLDIHSPIERLNVILENDVKTYLETVGSDYKELLTSIIDKLGYSSVGIEGYNGIFSYEMLSNFGVNFVTDMYKYCNLTGSKVNFELLITSGKLDIFKQVFDNVLGSQYNGTLSDIKMVKKIFDKCIKNSKLFEDILSNGIDSDVITNLRKYINSNFRINVNSVDELMNFDLLVKNYVDDVIASGNSLKIKDTISLLLFNASEGDMYDFNQVFGGTKKIDILAKKLGNSELSSILKGYSVLLKFYQNKVVSNNNSKSLIAICEKLNNMSYDERISYLKVFDDIDGFVRYCYGVEVNESLTKLDSIGIEGENTRIPGKYTWQDGSNFVPVDYVEVNSNYRLFQHTLNAFGEGGKLSDYQSGRVVGKTYLCLSMIGDNKIGVIRDTVDVDHVTLLFDNVVPQDLMACAPRDIGSSYRTENNQLFINNRGSRFDIVDNILSNTDAAEYNEYVIYRNNAKPAGILVTGVEANSAEIEAAARLGVPLVKINYSGNEKISSNNVEVSTEFSESMDEFIGYLTGKNGYTVAKNSPSGEIIYDGARNSDTVIDTTQDFEYELVDGESLRGKIGIQFFAKSSEANSKFSLKRIFGKNNSSVDTKVSELIEYINSLEDSVVGFELVSKLNKTDSKVLELLPIDVIELAIRKGYVVTLNTPKVIIDNIMTNSSDGEILGYAIDFYDKLIDDSSLIHKVLNSGYVISRRSPKFIRENYEYVLKFINSSDSVNITNFVNTLDPSVFTEEQLSNIIVTATKKGLVIDSRNTADYIKNSPKIIMDIVSSASSLELVSSVITYSNIASLSDFDIRQLVEKAKSLGYKLDIKSPIIELNRGLNLVDDQLLKSFDNEYRTILEELITKTGYIHVYFEGYDGIFSKDVIDLFGVDNVYQIYKYCNLVNIRLDFNELITRGELKAFKELYDTIYAFNSIDSEFDILNFKRFVSKYLSYDNIFQDIINRRLSESEILSIKSFVESSFDINVSSYDDLLHYNDLVKEYVVDVVNNGSIDDIREVSSKLLFNQDYSQTVEFFRDVADSERLYSLARELKDIDIISSHILEGYGVLFDTFSKFILNSSDIDKMKSFVLAINNSTDGNILKMSEDITRNIKYYYGLELNKTLTKLDGFVKHDGMFSGTKYLIDGNILDNNTSVDYIEVNSKYRLLQHKLNYGVSSGGKLTEYLNPRLIGNTYLCLSLIGDNKVGVNTESSSINEVTLVFDEIISRNLLLCSSADFHSVENVSNSLEVYAKDPYRFDIAEKILSETDSDWWNEYTIYRENAKPSGILVTGDAPVQAEIDAAATLGVPLVKINYSGDTNISGNSKDESSKPITNDVARNGGTIIDVSQDMGYELMNGESLASRIGTQFFATPKTNSGIVVDGLSTDIMVQPQDATGRVADLITVDTETGDISVDTTRNMLVDGNNFVVKMCSGIKDFINTSIIEFKVNIGKDRNITRLVDSLSELAFKNLVSKLVKNYGLIEYNFSESTQGFVRNNPEFILYYIEHGENINIDNMLLYANLDALSDEQQKIFVKALKYISIVLDENCPSVLKSNADFIMQCLNKYDEKVRKTSGSGRKIEISELVGIIENADLSVLSKEQLSKLIEIMKRDRYYPSDKTPSILFDNYEFISSILRAYSYQGEYSLEYSSELLSMLSSKNPELVSKFLIDFNYIINENTPDVLRGNLELIIKSLEKVSRRGFSLDLSLVDSLLSNSDFSNMSNDEFIELILKLEEIDYKFSDKTPSVLANFILNNSKQFSKFNIKDMMVYCDSDVLSEYFETKMPSVESYFSDLLTSKNGVVIADYIVNYGLDNHSFTRAIHYCSESVLRDNLDNILLILGNNNDNMTENYFGMNGINASIIMECIFSKPLLYSNLVFKFVDYCSPEMLKSNLDDLLRLLDMSDSFKFSPSSKVASILADEVIGNPLKYSNLVAKFVDYCSPDILKKNLTDVLLVLDMSNSYKFNPNSETTLILANGVISNPMKYSNLVDRAKNYCSSEVFNEHSTEVLEILNVQSNNIATDADEIIANPFKYQSHKVVESILYCSSDVLIEHLEDVLYVFNKIGSPSISFFSQYAGIMANVIISNPFRYPNLVYSSTSVCSEEILLQHLSDILYILNKKKEFPSLISGAISGKMANAIISEPLKYPNLVSGAVDYCSSDILISNIDVVLPMLNYLNLDGANFSILEDIVVKNLSKYPKLVKDVVVYCSKDVFISNVESFLSYYASFLINKVPDRLFTYIFSSCNCEISDSELSEFKLYIGNEFNLNFIIEKPQLCYEIFKHLKYTNSKTLYSFGKSLMPQLLVLDNPLDKLFQIEKIFVRNNLPLFGKQFLAFQILYPDLGKFYFGPGGHMSPQLQDMSLARMSSYTGKTLSSNDIRFNVIYNDLLRIAVRTNNIDLRKYLINLDEGNSLFLEISEGKLEYDKLTESDPRKKILKDFASHLETLYLNTVSGNNVNIDFSQYSLIDRITFLKEKFKPTSRYDLKDRIVRSFGYSAGITSFDSLVSAMDLAIREADTRGRRYAESLGTTGRFMFEQGDFVRGIGGYSELGSSLDGGHVCREFLTVFTGISSSDATPLDIDISLINKAGSVDAAMSETITGNSYGNVCLIIKKNNPNLNITRDMSGNLTSAQYDPSKIEMFSTLSSGHWGARTGIAITDVDYILYRGSTLTELNAIKFEIARHNFYMPVIDNNGQLIFTVSEYESLRSQMSGLSYYGASDYEFSNNLVVPGIDEIVSKFDYNDKLTTDKRDKIDAIMQTVFDEFDLTLSREITGDLMPGTVELIDTGSTGRNTNKIGDGDFDFLLRVDQQLYLNSERYNHFRSAILDKFSQYSIREIVVTGAGDYRLKGVQIDVDTVVDIDISFAIRTEAIDYSSDQCLKDRLKTMKKCDRERYKYAVSNVILAKQILKEAGVYKPYRSDSSQGGLGGIGIENWVLQHGGSFIDAARTFVAAAEGKNWTQFRASYTVWDFGQNHFADKNESYLYDNFVDCNMSEEGYKKMVSALKTYLASVEGHNFDYDSNVGDNAQVETLEIHDAVSVDSSRKGILGISKNSMLEMKLASASSRSIDSMISDGKLTEYLNSLTSSEIHNGPLARHVYQFANKMNLDAMGDSFVLLTREQFDQVDDFMDSIDDDLSQGITLSQESVDMMDAMSSEALVVVIDKLLSNSEYFESAKQVVKFIDDSVLGQVFDRIIVRDDSNVITSYLDADQVVSLMDYYSNDLVWYDKFCRNVSYAKFTKVARVLNEMVAKGDLNAVRMRNKLDRGIDSRFVSDIRSKYKNGTLSSYLSDCSNSKLGQLFEKMIGQKMSDSSTLCDSMIEMIGKNKFNILVRNGYIKFDTKFSNKTQNAILDIINQQRDGTLKELSVYGVDQGYIRSHIRYEIKTNWSDDVTDIASFISKNYGLGMFDADGKALSLTSPGYIMDYEEHQMIIDYLSSKYGKGDAIRMASKIFGRKVDRRYVAALNKLVSHGTDIKTAQSILDCIDTTGVCSYASVANLIVDAYKDKPQQFKNDFGFDLYTYENGRKEINSTELLADMYVYINSNLCGGKLFTIKDGKVTTKTAIIDTSKQVYLSSNYGFETGIVNKYLHSKNPSVTINVTSASQFYADGINSEIDNIKTAIVRAIQEGKQVTLGVYRTKGSQYSFLDEQGIKKESTLDWSEGDGHAVYVTGVTDNGVVVSTWGKRRIIPFTDFVDNMYSINFVEIGLDGSINANNQRKVPIYSNPTLAINDGRGSVMDGASLTTGLSDSQKQKIYQEAKKRYIKSHLGSDILKHNQIYLQKGFRVKADEFNIDRRKNKTKKLKLDTNAMIAARNQLSDREAIKLGKKQFEIEAEAYAQAVLDKAIVTLNNSFQNISEDTDFTDNVIVEENVQNDTVENTQNDETVVSTDVVNNTSINSEVNTEFTVDNNQNTNTNNVNKQIKLNKQQRAKIIRDAKKGYIKEKLSGVNKNEFYKNLGYEVKAKEIQFNTGKTGKINKNVLNDVKKLLTEAEAIKLGKETLEARALEYAEARVEDILAGKVEYKAKGSPIKKLAITSVGAIVLLSYLGSIGDIPLDNDISGDDILGTEEDDKLVDYEIPNDDSSDDEDDDGGGSPSSDDSDSNEIPEIISSDVMEPNEEVNSTILQDVPVIENVIEEIANGLNYGGQNNYVTNGNINVPNVETEKLPETILDDESVSAEEPYLIPMSSNYVDTTDKKDVSSKGIILGGMGLATLGALGTKLYLDKKKEDEEELAEEKKDDLEQEDNQVDIELVDNNDEEVDSDYEVPIFYSDTLKDEE